MHRHKIDVSQFTPPSMSESRRDAEIWNTKYPVGSPVAVRRVYWRNGKEPDGNIFEAITRTAATVLRSGEIVVWLEGHPGCYAIDCVEPLEGTAASRSGVSNVAVPNVEPELKTSNVEEEMTPKGKEFLVGCKELSANELAKRVVLGYATTAEHWDMAIVDAARGKPLTQKKADEVQRFIEKHIVRIEKFLLKNQGE